MPVVTTAPYATAGDVLDLTRSIINDAAQTIAGSILTNAAPFTFPLLNAAYRDLQHELIDSGVEVLTKETILEDILACYTSDPGVQVYVGYSGYNDGQTNYANPVLPADMIIPLRLWERMSDTTDQFVQMFPVNDGLPSISQGSQLRCWDWRTDAIYMVGSTQSNDLRLRYAAFLDELVDEDSPVMIARSENALAYFTAAQFAAARGSALAPGYAQQGSVYVDQMTKRTSRKKQRGQHRRNPYGTVGRNSAYGW